MDIVKRALVFPKFNGCKRMFAGSEVFFENVILNNKASKNYSNKKY